MPARIVVGLSGGVDSALAAALLQERGGEVVGCFLKVVIPGAPCPWAEDLPMAHRVAAHLGIPLIVRDVSAEYERDVLEPMIAAYRNGETPNPDATCNRWVKFDALRAVAAEVSADRIATGHYARIAYCPKSNIGHPSRCSELWRGIDHVKDQSYFLWMLTQEQLAMCEFPLGTWRKDDVRAEAQRRGLPNWDRESTSGVCFLGHVNLARFLASRAVGTPATVVTTAGEVIGMVPVGEAMTIGQRAPVAGQPTPRYVVAQSTPMCPTLSVGQSRRVVVSATPDDPARFTRTITTGALSWIGALPSLPLTCTARIRHRQEPQLCTVSVRESINADASRRHGMDSSNLMITFDTPLTGAAPGQAVVFTDGDRVLGGAVLDSRP